jgi:hypothetical protein
MERIDRWATSGKATKILIHPEDYDRIGEKKRATLEAKYQMPVVCVGGEKAYFDWKHRTKTEEQIEEMMNQEDNS